MPPRRVGILLEPVWPVKKGAEVLLLESAASSRNLVPKEKTQKKVGKMKKLSVILESYREISPKNTAFIIKYRDPHPILS